MKSICLVFNFLFVLNFYKEICLSWAETQCAKKQLPSTVENWRKVLKDVFFHIRFLSMDKEQFSLRVVPTNVLSAEEALEIFKYWCTFGKTQLPKFNKKAREIRKVFTIRHLFTIFRNFS